MSAAAVALVYNRIADDLLSLAYAVLEDDSISTNTKIGKNTLANSQLRDDLSVAVSQTIGEDAVIRALFNNYVVYLEWSRPPMYGKKPPISALKDWAAKNGIPTDAGTLYAISYAIWRDGHAGRPIFATMDKVLDGLFIEDWAPALKDAIFDNLDLLFND
jgi:hypothetical protein